MEKTGITQEAEETKTTVFQSGRRLYKSMKQERDGLK